LGLTDADWTAFYRLFSEGRYKATEASQIILEAIVEKTAVSDDLWLVSDGFPVPKSSQTMPGTGWMKGLQTAKFKPGIQRGQRFAALSYMTPLENGYSRAIPVRCVPAFTEKAVENKEAEPQTEVAACVAMLKWMRQVLEQNGRGKQRIVSLNDGGYDRLEYWGNLPTDTIGIVRTAKNRVLYELPPEGAHGNTKYGKRALTPSEFLRNRKGFHSQQVTVRGESRRIRYQVQGPFVREGLASVPLFLIVIGGGKRPKGSRSKTYQPCFFLVSAVWQDGEWRLPLPIATILAWLWQRWEVEVAHRQMKSCLGLGEKQCWHPMSTITSVQWSVWVYTLMILTGFLVWGNLTGPPPPGPWRKPPKRWSFNTLWRGFRAELWGNQQFRAVWTESSTNWLRFESHLASLFNAATASARA
jgi:hypothetical protein